MVKPEDDRAPSRKPADRKGFDSRAKAVYMNGEPGQPYINVDKCPDCKALVEVEDLGTHQERMHPDDPIEMSGG